MKLPLAVIVGSALMGPGSGVKSPPAFNGAAYARLAPGTPELGRRFDWPALAAFRGVHQKAAAAEPVQLIGGRAKAAGVRSADEQDVLVAIDPTRGAGVVHVSTERGSSFFLSELLVRIPVERWLAPGNEPISAVSGETRIVVSRTARGPLAAAIDQGAWNDWTYTTTLLAHPQPVYLAGPDDRHGEEDDDRRRSRLAREAEHVADVQRAIEAHDTPAARAAIAAALATSVEETGIWRDHGWEAIAAWAEEHEAIDAALGVRSRFRPVGRCSMDSSPQVAAEAYADLCYSAGRLGCFLDLQIQIMGDQFQRMAYSSYGEAVHETGAERLRGIGIDPARFLRGLLFRFAVAGSERRELEPWRLARSMREAGLTAVMTTFTRLAASNRELDPFNRLRAAQTYAYLRLQHETPPFPMKEDDAKHRALVARIRAELAAFDLPEPAIAWARAFGKGD